MLIYGWRLHRDVNPKRACNLQAHHLSRVARSVKRVPRDVVCNVKI